MTECPWCSKQVSLSSGNCSNCGNELDLIPEVWAASKPLSLHNQRASA